MTQYAPLDIGPNWGRLNETIVTLVDYIPDDKLGWSPSPELWNFKGILLHFSLARHNWLGNVVKDGQPTPDVLAGRKTKEMLRGQLRLSWQRVARFLSDPANLACEYTGMYFGQEQTFTGNWIAFHLLEHDAHHRADLYRYLAMLGIEHPEVETP